MQVLNAYIYSTYSSSPQTDEQTLASIFHLKKKNKTKNAQIAKMRAHTHQMFMILLNVMYLNGVHLNCHLSIEYGEQFCGRDRVISKT